MPNFDEPLQTLIFLRLLEKEKAALVEEKEQLVRASQELLSSQVDNQLPFDPNDPKVKELEEWECSVSRSVIVEVGPDISLIYLNRGCGPAIPLFMLFMFLEMIPTFNVSNQIISGLSPQQTGKIVQIEEAKPKAEVETGPLPERKVN